MRDVCGWRDYPGAQLSLTVGRFGGFKITANRQKIGITLGWVLVQLWFFDKSEWDREALGVVESVACAYERSKTKGAAR